MQMMIDLPEIPSKYICSRISYSFVVVHPLSCRGASISSYFYFLIEMFNLQKREKGRKKSRLNRMQKRMKINLVQEIKNQAQMLLMRLFSCLCFHIN